MKRLCAGCLVALIAGLAGTPQPAEADTLKDKTPVKIGMAKTMVVDVPQVLVELLGYPFSSMMKEFTGLEGKLQVGGSPAELAQNVEEGRLELAVFQGMEYAWVQGKFPNLKPLMVALYQDKCPHAQLVVHKDSGIKSFADLRGKNVAYPKRSPQHCRAFLERHCSECGECASKGLFDKLHHPGSVERALDDLVHGAFDAVVVDKVCADFYQSLKPGAFSQLRVVKSSEAFPSTVVVYKEGGVCPKMLGQFREGMMKANKSERGRELMLMWRVTSFEPVPEDYQKTVDEILKVYPGPETRVSAFRGGE